MFPLLLLQAVTPASAAISDEYQAEVVSLLSDGYTCGRVAFVLQAADSGWQCALSPVQRGLTTPLGCLAALDSACVDVGAVDGDGDGFSPDDGDCDDTASEVNPAQTEVCDGVDNDCDGAIDVGAADADGWYRDADGDGVGSGPVVLTACTAPGTLVASTGDCSPLDATIYPGAPETCDGVDQDCDGIIDDDAVDATTWYADADGDSFGDPSTSVDACVAVSTYVLDRTDCDDADALSYPGAPETCDGADNDCNGVVDDDAVDLATFYADADGDGFGDAGTSVEACDAPAGYLADRSDCDDASAVTYPGALELCDGLDNGCDGAWVDDAGVVSLYESDGAWSDLSDTFAAGADGAPATYTIAHGDTVYVCEGTWYVSLDLDGSGAIVGLGDADAVVLDGGGVARVIDAAGTGDEVWLENLTVQRGYTSGSGGGVSLRNLGSLTLLTVNLLDSRADTHGGGGYFWNLDYSYWSDVYLAGNSADSYGGGAIVAQTTLWEGDGITFADNASTGSSAYGGGGLASYGTSNAANLRGLYMTGNTSARYGGGWEIYNGTYAVEGCEITDSVAGSGGGGIDMAAEADLSLTDCDVSSNSGASGGMRLQGPFTGDAVTFSSNVGSGNAGAIQIASGGVGSCQDCVFTDNTSATAAVNIKSGEFVVDNGYFYGNDPADLYAASTSYVIDGYATFDCTDSSCF